MRCGWRVLAKAVYVLGSPTDEAQQKFLVVSIFGAYGSAFRSHICNFTVVYKKNLKPKMKLRVSCGLLRVCFMCVFFCPTILGCQMLEGPWDAIGVLRGVWLGHADGAAFVFFEKMMDVNLWY